MLRRRPVDPNAPAIDPRLARLASGYSSPDDEESEMPPDDEYAENEAPQRVAARAAMSGEEPPMPQGPPEEAMPSREEMMAQEMNETPADEAAESPAYQERERRLGVERHHLGAGARHHKRFSPHEKARKMRLRY